MDSLGYLEYDGRLADLGPAGFVWIGQTAGGPDTWLNVYAPDFLEVEFGEDDGYLDGNTVSFRAKCRSDELPVDYDADFTCTYREDGTLDAMSVTFSYDADEGGRVVREFAMEVLDEAPEETRRILEEAAASAMEPEEAERIKREKDYVLEIPSNRTDYDRDFPLGAGQMGWELMDGQWFIKFGAENVTDTSLELVYESSGPYGAMGVSDLEGVVRIGNSCVIEVLKDGKWEFYGDGPKLPLEPRNLSNGSRISVRWDDALGALPGGLYRVGL